MNTVYEDDTHCVLSALHPAYAYIPACKTDVSRTFAEHSTADLYASDQVETEQIHGHHEGADYWMNQGD